MHHIYANEGSRIFNEALKWMGRDGGEMGTEAACIKYRHHDMSVI